MNVPLHLLADLEHPTQASAAMVSVSAAPNAAASGSPAADATPDPSRPVLVMLCNAQTPYRLAFHLRIARELPEYRLVSLFTHEVSNSPWVIDSPPEIGPVLLGRGQGLPSGLVRAGLEYFKGKRIIDHLKRLKPAAVVVHGYNDLGRLRVLRWCHRRGIPAFLWADSNVFSDSAVGLKHVLKMAVIRYAVSCTRGVMVCGRLGHEYFRRFVGNSLQSFLVPYEPDYSLIQTLPMSEVRRVAGEYGWPAERQRLIYSGRLAPEKRVDLLVSAFVRLAPERPTWDLVLMGDGPERDRLKALIPPELADRVFWLGFVQDTRRIAAVYHNCDVLCLPSTTEPWAVVINEAAAAGLGIVASHVVGAAAELVREGVNGRIFTSNQPDELLVALRDITHPEKTNQYRRASLEVLADWRVRADPILGLRRALASVQPATKA